jgi:hypothetical protein
MLWTGHKNIPYNRLCKILTSKWDLDLGGRDAGVAHDILSCYSDYLCLVFWQFLWFMKKLWTGHKKYPITDYVNLWPPSVTLTLEVGDRLLRMTHCLIIVINCGKFWWPWMSKCDLTLEVGVWLLRMTHGLIITNISAKLFQNPLIKVMDRTR